MQPLSAESELDHLLREAANHQHGGAISEALDCLDRAVTLNLEQGVPALEALLDVAPGRADILARLGRAYLAQGRTHDAMHKLEDAIRLGDDSHEVWYALGTAYRSLGLEGEASKAYQQVLMRMPHHAEAADALGCLVQQAGHLDTAVALFRTAITAKPDFAMAHFHLGNALYGLGNLEEASTAYRNALMRAPEHVASRNNLAVTLKAMGRLAEAELHLRIVVHLDPDYSEAYNNLGNVLSGLGRLEEGEHAFRKALAVDRTNAQAYNNLGIALQAMGSVDAALQCFDTAVLLQPRFARAHWNRAIALLLKGDYEQGFQEYEWGFEAGTRLWLDFGKPRWAGGGEPGKTLLIHCEQGLGDTLQFVRYLQHARTLVGQLILVCQPELKRLLQGVKGADLVLSEADPLPAFDFHLPLMSLPMVLGGGLDATARYVSAPDPGSALAGQGLKVGLVWAGSPTHQNDVQRSCGFEALRPLLGIPGVQFFSLQKGPANAQLADSRVIDVTNIINDFSDTAKVLSQLDLVLTVDTAVAHLAGAMGIPVWVMLPFAPDWRWGEAGDDTAWYPSARLFRQRHRGDWTAPIQAVHAALQERLAVANPA